MENIKINNPDLAEAIIAHHLRIFGYEYESSLTQLNGRKVKVLCYPTSSAIALSECSTEEGDLIVAIQPCEELCNKYQADIKRSKTNTPEFLYYKYGSNQSGRNLRTLGSYQYYNTPFIGEAVVTNQMNDAVWLWKPSGKGGILFVGSDLSNDLVRFDCLLMMNP